MQSKVDYAVFVLKRAKLSCRDVESITSGKNPISRSSVADRAEKGAVHVDHFLNDYNSEITKQRRVYVPNIENISAHQDIFNQNLHSNHDD